jgi:hypothetical protein
MTYGAGLVDGRRGSYWASSQPTRADGGDIVGGHHRQHAAPDDVHDYPRVTAMPVVRACSAATFSQAPATYLGFLLVVPYTRVCT